MDPSVSIEIGQDETRLHNASVYAGIAMQRFQVDMNSDFEQRSGARYMVIRFIGEQAELAADYLQNMATAKGMFSMRITTSGTEPTWKSH
jgi:hypothetical protein